MSYKVTTLTNGLRVVNLMDFDVHFDDETVAPAATEPPHLQLRTIRRKAITLDKAQIDSVIGRDLQKQMQFLTAEQLPDIDVLEQLRKELPKGALYLVRTHSARCYGFPFVTPAYVNTDDNGRKIHSQDRFIVG